jgi:peptide/nickel transport system permease protein
MLSLCGNIADRETMQEIGSKILYGLLVLLGVILLVFSLFVFLPNPAQQTLGQRSDKQSIENINKEFGLDKPKYIQFFLYLNDVSFISIHPSDEISKYDGITLVEVNQQSILLKKPYLRLSYQNKRPVMDVLMDALPNTLILALSSFLMASFLGIAFGIIASVKRGTIWESSLMLVALMGVSVPSFFAAILLSTWLGYDLQHITGLNMFGSLYSYDPFEGKTLRLDNLILPTIALGLRPLAIITQLTRSAMLDVLSMDFIRTARAKGLSYPKTVMIHGLRNALNPVVTAMGSWLASLLAGAFFIEFIFNWHGLGKVTIDALTNSDFPVVVGAVIFMASVFVIMNILTDIAYKWIDPRVR